MKLLYLQINSDFRNLKGLKLELSPDTNTYVIIGNNGTGKTNILEALSSIFSVLLSHSTNFLFSFVLRYKLDEDIYVITHETQSKKTIYKKKLTKSGCIRDNLTESYCL